MHGAGVGELVTVNSKTMPLLHMESACLSPLSDRPGGWINHRCPRTQRPNLQNTPAIDERRGVYCQDDLVVCKHELETPEGGSNSMPTTHQSITAVDSPKNIHTGMCAFTRQLLTPVLRRNTTAHTKLNAPPGQALGRELRPSRLHMKEWHYL